MNSAASLANFARKPLGFGFIPVHVGTCLDGFYYKRIDVHLFRIEPGAMKAIICPMDAGQCSARRTRRYFGRTRSVASVADEYSFFDRLHR